MFAIRRPIPTGVCLLFLLGGVLPASAQVPLPAVDQPAPKPTTVSVTENEGLLTFATPDGRFRWAIEGRLMLDAAAYGGGEAHLSNGIEIRRARAGFRMVFWKDWSAKFEVDFADNEVAIKDMWIAYAVSPNASIKAGQFTEPLGLEQINSSRYTTFVERSLIAGLVPDRHIGAAYTRSGPRWQATGGVFGQTVGQKDVSGDNQGFDLTGRVTVAPILSGAHVVHLGLAASRRSPPAARTGDLGDRQQWSFQLRPETHVSRGCFLDTGVIPNVDHLAQVGVEAAVVWGPWSVQGEYLRTSVARTTAPSAVFDGWYGYATWFITGEHRPYHVDAGDFGRLVPKRRRGAVELVARYSVASLDDPSAGISGGTERIATGGVNWYFNPNLRLAVNVLAVRNNGSATGLGRYRAGTGFAVVQTRLQLQF